MVSKNTKLSRDLKAARKPLAMIEITTADAPEVTEEPIFSIDGTIYAMEVPVSAAMTLQVLERMAEEGETSAMMWAVKQLIGEDGYEALSTCDALTGDQLEAILNKINDLVMGNVEATRGN